MQEPNIRKDLTGRVSHHLRVVKPRKPDDTNQSLAAEFEANYDRFPGRISHLEIAIMFGSQKNPSVMVRSSNI